VRVAHDHAAVVDDGDLVAHLLRLFQVMRGQDDRHALPVQRAHVFPQHLAQFDVHARGGFVQHQHLRPCTSALPSSSRRRIPPDSVRA
jgi:hypothetical protein